MKRGGEPPTGGGKDGGHEGAFQTYVAAALHLDSVARLWGGVTLVRPTRGISPDGRVGSRCRPTLVPASALLLWASLRRQCGHDLGPPEFEAGDHRVEAWLVPRVEFADRALDRLQQGQQALTAQGLHGSRPSHRPADVTPRAMRLGSGPGREPGPPFAAEVKRPGLESPGRLSQGRRKAV